MDIGRLVTMANEIAAFFAVEPGGEAAPAQVANHLRRFWAPRMRREILAHLDAGGTGLSDLARRGIELIR